MQRALKLESFGEFSSEITLKKIRHIYFKVDYSRKVVSVSAPLGISQSVLNNAVEAKKKWIQKQIVKAGTTKSVPADLFFTRHHIWIWGEKRFINTLELDGLDISVSKNWTHNQTAIHKWLDNEMKQKIRQLVDQWEPKLGVSVTESRIRKMRTRWGSCNINAKRIWLNRVLVHLDPCLLEYVVVHEMAHLLERKHNQRFKNLMTQLLPHWPEMKARLSEISL